MEENNKQIIQQAAQWLRDDINETYLFMQYRDYTNAISHLDKLDSDDMLGYKIHKIKQILIDELKKASHPKYLEYSQILYDYTNPSIPISPISQSSPMFVTLKKIYKQIVTSLAENPNSCIDIYKLSIIN